MATTKQAKQIEELEAQVAELQEAVAKLNGGVAYLADHYRQDTLSVHSLPGRRGWRTLSAERWPLPDPD